MTSRECFVYLQMPGSLEVATCGRYQLDQLPDSSAVGRFVYGRRYRQRRDAVPIDPIGLPLSDRVYETAGLHGLHSALRDAAPDGWGRRVIEQKLGRSDLTELHYLLEAPEEGAGALRFGASVDPPADELEYNTIVRLGDLMEAAALLERGLSPEDLPPALMSLVQPGTSLGGARPKAVVEGERELWVAKFPAHGDRWNNAAVEAGMLSLAAVCGICVPEYRVERLGEQAVLLIKRFDRDWTDDGYLRHRVLSGLTVLAADEVSDRSRWSYLLLADELKRLSARSDDDREELFRRMVFNALISNSDDHPRNHAVVAAGHDFVLAPAYDLVPQPSHSQERRLAMDAGLEGRAATRRNLLSGVGRFGLKEDKASKVIDSILGLVREGWERAIAEQGGTQSDRDSVASAFAHEGFEF